MAQVKKYNFDGTECMVEVQVGDYVRFKADVEQGGRVTVIKRSEFGSGYRLTIRAMGEDGFSGDYIGGQTVTVQSASDCWIE